MGMEVRRKGPITILQISGRMVRGGGETDALKEKFRGLLEEGDRKFLLDLLRVPFQDTEAMNAVVMCHQWARAREGVLKVVVNQTLRGHYIRMFFNKLFEMYDDAEAGLASFAS